MFLASSYGLVPDPWQADEVLPVWLGTRADGSWASSRNGLSVPRQNGKNGALEVRELFGMVDLGERFLHTAHEVKTARKAFARLLEFFDSDAHPELRDLVKEIRRTNGQEAILLRNGGGVEFIARSKGSGRGFTVDVLVLDEAQELTDETYSALLYTISSAPLGNPQQILMGTPPGPKANGEVFTRMRERALADDGGRVSWLEWGCKRPKGGSVDVSDRGLWAQANPALGIRISEEAVADELDASDPTDFARERLGMWDVGSVGGLIPSDVWAALADPRSTTRPGCFAVDVNPERSWACIVAAGVSGERRHVEITGAKGVIDHRPGTAWVAGRLAELHERWRVPVAVNPSGAAGSLIPELEKVGFKIGRGKRRGSLVLVSGQEYAAACGMFFDATREGASQRLVHIGQPSLASAVDAGRKRVQGESWVWHRRDTSADITPLVAATLALWGLGKASARRERTGEAAFV